MTQGVATLDIERPLGRPADALVDPFGRAISYLRVSVTDRCDFRCVYCMAENMTFLPKADLLSLEELDRLCSVFVDNGVRKLRLTGRQPPVRRAEDAPPAPPDRPASPGDAGLPAVTHPTRQTRS